ncbi:MAG: hypothetical protein ACLFM7_11225 [Bacteroidales bacterium]
MEPKLRRARAGPSPAIGRDPAFKRDRGSSTSDGSSTHVDTGVFIQH